MQTAARLLAHQGGWDEALLVAAPIAIFVALLRIANKRADRLAETDPDDQDPGPGTTP